MRIPLPLYALRRTFTAKFDDKSLQFDDAKSSTVLRRQTVDRLVVGLQNKLPLCVQVRAMGRGTTLEGANAARPELRVCTITGRKTSEHECP